MLLIINRSYNHLLKQNYQLVDNVLDLRNILALFSRKRAADRLKFSAGLFDTQSMSIHANAGAGPLIRARNSRRPIMIASFRGEPAAAKRVGSFLGQLKKHPSILGRNSPLGVEVGAAFSRDIFVSGAKMISLAAAGSLRFAPPLLGNFELTAPEKRSAATPERALSRMLDRKVKFSVLGHSIRRDAVPWYDAEAAPKIRSVLKAVHGDRRADGFFLLYCLDCCSAGPGGAVGAVEAQLASALRMVFDRTDIAGRLVLALEFGGTGSSAAADDAAGLAAFVRTSLASRMSERTAEKVRILYSGSPDRATALGVLERPELDGLFLTNAADDPEVFSEALLKLAPAAAKPERPSGTRPAGSKKLSPEEKKELAAFRKALPSERAAMFSAARKSGTARRLVANLKEPELISLFAALNNDSRGVAPLYYLSSEQQRVSLVRGVSAAELSRLLGELVSCAWLHLVDVSKLTGTEVGRVGEAVDRLMERDPELFKSNASQLEGFISKLRGREES